MDIFDKSANSYRFAMRTLIVVCIPREIIPEILTHLQPIDELILSEENVQVCVCAYMRVSVHTCVLHVYMYLLVLPCIRPPLK